MNNDGRLDLYVCRFAAPNLLYINLHSSNFPGGEIRGQLKSTKTVFDLDGEGRTDLVFRCWKRPTVRAGGTRARFWVRDGGPGLSAAAQAALFVPFTRISTVRATGHGLGLSIVRRIAEKLGGEVGVDSTPGAGSCFWFELPTRPPTARAPDLPPPPLFLP